MFRIFAINRFIERDRIFEVTHVKRAISAAHVRLALHIATQPIEIAPLLFKRLNRLLEDSARISKSRMRITRKPRLRGRSGIGDL